jgi:adenosylhomocysteine nucleosidase
MGTDDLKFAVLIAANAEWSAVRMVFPKTRIERSPYGEYFFAQVEHERLLFFQTGWGKVAASASTQYVIDSFNPAYLINLGTCGGIEGRVQRFDIVAPERVVIYDIYEAMGDATEAVAHYSTTLELPVNIPFPVIRTTLYSADRDLTPAALRDLEHRYRPVVVDWESGAIAWVANRNGTPLLILRGVSDLVSVERAEADGDYGLYERNAARIMTGLIRDLPKCIRMLT